MRRRTVRNGLRLVAAALMLIIVVSYYHGLVADLFSLAPDGEQRVYQLGIFWAAALGGYGVVQAVFGFLMASGSRDHGIRIMPTLLLIAGMVLLFFLLLAGSLGAPRNFDRLRPGETITI